MSNEAFRSPSLRQKRQLHSIKYVSFYIVIERNALSLSYCLYDLEIQKNRLLNFFVYLSKINYYY